MYLPGDTVFKTIINALAYIALLILAGIFAFLLFESTTVLETAGLSSFFYNSDWYPLEGEFNITPMIIGSILITAGAIVLSVPASLAVSVVISFYLPSRFKQMAIRILETLSGIPSVVYGLCGILYVVPAIAAIDGPGTSLLAGSLVLAMMILPGLSILFCFAIESRLNSYYLPSRAAGLNKTETLIYVIIPLSLPEMIRVLILQIARAIGETMAVLMVCGNVVQNPQSVFSPVRTLTTNTALEMAYAMDTHRSALFFGGLVLMSCVAFLFVLSRRIKVNASHYAQ